MQADTSSAPMTQAAGGSKGGNKRKVLQSIDPNSNTRHMRSKAVRKIGSKTFLMGSEFTYQARERESQQPVTTRLQQRKSGDDPMQITPLAHTKGEILLTQFPSQDFT